MTIAMRQRLLKLTPREKIRLIGELWDSMDAQHEGIPVPKWHKRVLRKRVAEHKRNPHDAIPWREMKARLLKRTKA